MSEVWESSTQCRVASRLATYYVGFPEQNSVQISNLFVCEDDSQYACSVPIKSETVDERGEIPRTPIDEGFDIYVMGFLDAHSHLPSAVQGEALLSGGVPGLYDGERLSEYGFHFAPLINASSAYITESAGELVTGELSPSTTYQWVAVYSWLDSSGVRHQSWLSNAVGITTSAAVTGIEVQMVVWNLTLTEHEDAYNASQPVQIELYRKGGTTDGFYHLDQIITNNKTSDITNVVSSISDAEIEVREILYTEGGVIEDGCPPAAKHIVAHSDRLWLISADNDEFLWVSKINGQDSRLPGFATELVVRTDIGAGCTAIASLDDKLIAFKQRETYMFAGEPDSDQGIRGNLNGPNAISVQTGCIDPRSVCNCPPGVVFQAQDGIYLLTRGLQVQKISRPVEDTLRTYPVVTSAVHWADAELVLVTVTDEDETEGVILVWHYAIDEWTVWFAVGEVGESAAAQKLPIVTGAICSRAGVLTYHHAQSGLPIAYSDQSSWSDTGARWIALKVTTPWISFNGVQGYQQVQRFKFFGTYRSTHSLTVKVYHDHETTADTTISYTAGQVAAMVVDTKEQVDVHVARQRCESIRVELIAAQSGLGSGRCVRWESIAYKFGKSRIGIGPLPEARRR